MRITARNMYELKGLLKKHVRFGRITQDQADAIIAKASVSEHKPVLSKETTISSEAFPSIVKTAVNYYLDSFHDTVTIQHLIPKAASENGDLK